MALTLSVPAISLNTKQSMISMIGSTGGQLAASHVILQPSCKEHIMRQLLQLS
jgi:hypothetical protein